ncbi:hypothetical protein AVEN_200105-1 [Araneus ventricosus]|uniref:Uncharacterized protein n=1 Tax=Araneus ventricosus TaxID=182803 RepID=A0A4Y2Q595_ARAVE|nr:hypothetical protein AVEN_200105-1 [Araneus ventricosus]
MMIKTERNSKKMLKIIYLSDHKEAVRIIFQKDLPHFGNTKTEGSSKSKRSFGITDAPSVGEDSVTEKVSVSERSQSRTGPSFSSQAPGGSHCSGSASAPADWSDH